MISLLLLSTCIVLVIVCGCGFIGWMFRYLVMSDFVLLVGVYLLDLCFRVAVMIEFIGECVDLLDILCKHCFFLIFFVCDFFDE